MSEVRSILLLAAKTVVVQPINNITNILVNPIISWDDGEVRCQKWGFPPSNC